MTAPVEPCCDYRDHSGDHAVCSCECHDTRLPSPCSTLCAGCYKCQQPGPRHPTVGFLPDSCGAETRARYSWGGGEWLTCDRHAGHDGEHEDEYSGYKWGDR